MMDWWPVDLYADNVSDSADYNDGSGYWYSLRTMPDGSFVVEIRGDDNGIISESDFTYPTVNAAVEAAQRTIQVYRGA